MTFRVLCLLAMTVFSLFSCEEKSLSDDGVLVPLTVIEDASLPSISINGVLLHSKAYGNPSHPMVVAIHGGPGADYRSLLNFKQLVDDSMYVVFYDQRGSGLSERLGKNAYDNIQVYIDELAGVITHYQQDSTQKVILAGHSWGAMLATAYINQQPDAVTGAILAEPGGFTWEQTESYINRSRKLELFAESTNDFVYQDQIITGSDHNTLDYKLILSTAADISTGDIGPPPYWRYGAICQIASFDLAINYPEQLNFTANLSNYKTKVLFAYSELNSAYGVEHARLVSAALPSVDLIEIMGCGHEMPHYGWNNFYPLIKDYLNEIL